MQLFIFSIIFSVLLGAWRMDIHDKISSLEKKVEALERCACLQSNYTGDVSRLFPSVNEQQNNQAK